MKSFFLLFLMSLFGFSAYTQNDSANGYKLFVNLEKAPFDSLSLQDYTENKTILFTGRKVSEFTWMFLIPDSIALNSERMMLLISQYDSTSNATRNVRFFSRKYGERKIISNVGVEDSINYINARYEGKTIFKDEKFSVQINNKDSIILGDIVCEDFELIVTNDSSDIAIRSQDPYFSWFLSYDNKKNISYEDYLSSYVNLSKRYPDSRFLISSLSGNLDNYKSKKDVKDIYDNFSEKHKQSKWAKKIERFLFDKFYNISLPNLTLGTREEIIQDTTKYNLVVFSASWCKPCIEEIPILKKIYQDLQENLNLTYISIDEEKDLKAFQKLLVTYNIPWRSLFAYENPQGVKDLYFVKGIPHCLFIYPNGNMEIIDVRKDELRKKIYTQVLP
ncbi:thioredoxin domain-containing protein [Sphingobacterium sp. SRCM116780]|uniref:TlpA family protein disulfide reductase n=1 Tax=Sphingobacterium sp. SRCM116780 TaxID=2907623 RepID=UPI001F356F7B|nr:thioredoxin-like domain-containing protein [Sphingobacterium sp. SRCM116780]UIR57197.1 thioredoxin domain-containing protein [Sphingobacterium sp. SRCM116780]